MSTVYGEIEGARKGHNIKHRGKKGLRPVLCFLAETREYLSGKQRRRETISSREVAGQIRQFRRLLPEYVREVRVRGDGEFIGWESVKACLDEGFRFIFGNKRCDRRFPRADGIGTGTMNTTRAGISRWAGSSPVDSSRCASTKTSGAHGS